MKIVIFLLLSATSSYAMEKMDLQPNDKKRAGEELTAEIQSSAKKQRVDKLASMTLQQMFDHLCTLEEGAARQLYEKMPKDLIDKIVGIPFFRAIEDGKLHAIELLVTVFQADVTAKNIYGYTPLQIAAVHCGPAIPLIIEAAKCKFFTDDRFRALHDSLEVRPPNRMDKFLMRTEFERLGGEDAQFDAFYRDENEFLKYVNYFAPDGNTALHLACRHHPDAIPLLLEQGSGPNKLFLQLDDPQVDPDWYQYRGEYLTPLMEAAKNKDGALYLPLFMRADADVWITSINGEEAIWHAINSGNIDAVEYLARYMATQGRDRDKWNPEYVAETIEQARQMFANPDDLARVLSILSKDYSSAL
jgi:ankyrin repeat protein